MQVWQFIYNQLKAENHVMLLWVLESEGSSPGRKGFKMAVSKEGTFCGTIGGGIMEHKLVEKAKALLAAQESTISLVRQYHDKEHSKNQSGMICSGSQVIAFVPLFKKDISVIEKILSLQNNRGATVHLSLTGVDVSTNESEGFYYMSEGDWRYSERIDPRPLLHIIGGGHVSLALSQLMSFLNFTVNVYDNRDDLPTMEQNTFAREKLLVTYETIGSIIASNPEEYVVIASFGYRDDKIIFKQLLDKDFRYLGVLGSDSKIETLLKELQVEGINPERWKHFFLPIGIPIFSKTPQEIAVSIAAQIIREKNKDLPTGRADTSFN